VKRYLSEGDYCISGHESACLVERKGSINEVAMNCLSRDRKRFVDALERLADSTEHPVLFLEGSPVDLTGRLQPGSNLPESGPALDALFDLTHRYNIDLVIAPAKTVRQRRAAGEMVARLLLSAVLH
jgi:hypothetical protein